MPSTLISGQIAQHSWNKVVFKLNSSAYRVEEAEHVHAIYSMFIAIIRNSTKAGIVSC